MSYSGPDPRYDYDEYGNQAGINYGGLELYNQSRAYAASAGGDSAGMGAVTRWGICALIIGGIFAFQWSRTPEWAHRVEIVVIILAVIAAFLAIVVSTVRGFLRRPIAAIRDLAIIALVVWSIAKFAFHVDLIQSVFGRR